MSCLGSIQDEIRAHLRGAGFLRRDRDARVLFITDYLLRNDDAPAVLEALTGAGFAVTCERGLWRIDLSPWRQAALIDSLPRRSLPARVPDELLPLLSLCRSLLSQGDVPARDQPWPPIRQTLLLLAAGDRQRLWQTLSAQTALCKRTHAPLPAAAAYAIMEDTLGEEGERFFLEPRKKKLVVT